MKPLLHALTLGLSVVALACAVQAQTRQDDNPLPPNIASQPAPTVPATEGQAKELVLRDGYSDVGPLTKGADGMWRGTAKRGDQEMRVTVDTKGRVSP